MLGRHEDLVGRTLAVVVGESDSQRWGEFARQFVVASRQVAVEDRPRLMIMSGKSCAAIAESDPLLSGIWWWGVLDRLDTSLHLRSHLGDEVNELLRDCIVEVAGYDLRLAEYLATTWEGSHASLSKVLLDYPGAPHACVAETIQLSSSSTRFDVPPAAMLSLWDEGLVDRWDSFAAYLHACAVSTQADLRSRVWRAQVRVLMPILDEERARIEVWIRRQIKGLAAGDVLEAGELYDIFQDHPRLKDWRGGHRKRLVYWLRNARNTLAHLDTLTPDEVARGRQLINNDRRHE
jgi:hypothetical protein